MKRSYTKPLFAMEVFPMMQSSARDCADNVPVDNLTAGDISSCGWEITEGFIVFVPGPNCNFDGDTMGGIFCYNAPGEGNYIFRS